MERLRKTVSEGNGRLFLLILLMAMFSSIVVCNAFANPPAQVPKTGLTESYARGDDGDLQRGVAWPSPRFTDNNDGTVTDNLTGLVWLKNADCFGEKNWWDAHADVYRLRGGSCGLSDGSRATEWRVPNIIELRSLLNFGQPEHAAWLNTQGFQNVRAGEYWSSTTNERDYASSAFITHMTTGRFWGKWKREGGYVWPVRSGQTAGVINLPQTGQRTSYAAGDDGDLEKGVEWPSPRFTVNRAPNYADLGSVTDNLTGLVWLKNADCFGALSWREALTRVNALEGGRCGLSDGSTAGQWRLPNINELSSLLDFKRRYPALPEGHPFSNVNYVCYWTSNIYLNDIYRAWIVEPGRWGGIHTASLGGDFCLVWPVRDQIILTVTKIGTGSGTVTSSPSGINCGSTCSTTFSSGTSVTLTATAASGSVFVGWSDACSGTSRTCTVTMDASKNVTAIFNTGTTQCTYTISASPETFSSSAGTGIVRVTPSSTDCYAEWYLTSNSSWLNFTYTCASGICTSNTANGIGAGTASFRVDANSGASQRTGTISLTGGNSVTITQSAGGSCTQCGISFSDVPITSYAYNDILAIGCTGITQGCGTNLYCPSQNVSRAQIAAFIVRAKEGEPPADYCSSGSWFNDVSDSDGFCKYIKRLSELQITQGCGNGNYCPSDVVTRGQMAVFIIRALYGENFSYTTTPYFSDVPSSHAFFKYVQKLKDEGLTTSVGVYNVDGTVTREQMAAFLYRAFLRQSCGG